MAIRHIFIYGDPLLHEKAEDVDKIDDEILELIDDMFETMLDGKGVGLAATQLGILKSVIVLDVNDSEEENNKGTMLEMINTQILEREGLCTFEEGCLSIPGVVADVERPAEITVRFMNREGEWKEMTCGGLLARIIQHEYDHLQGILFTQHLLPSIRKKLQPQLRKLAKGVEV